ncbi:hypothetical protein [Sphingopyxis sp. KK2]|uniref:hypothetical protein n=1 Tax=Sphingopyxis sp. KK2 TaxID=1855727 RepID=UPI00097E63C6|nr:hypothetical protein [Sphingopyxis sp. KK2]
MERSLRRFSGIRGTRHELPEQLVISLTSYPPRFVNLSKTLKSLLDQAVRADVVILWVAEADFPLLPADVLALRDAGLRIATCPDWRSYKKIVPALSMFPTSIIVTADDDVFYDRHWLDGLVKEHERYPDHVVGYRAHLAVVRKNEQGFEKYSSWPFNISATEDQGREKLIFPTGMGGILYPPNSLHAEVFDASLFMDICRDADDVWLFWMARMAGFPHRRVPSRFEEIIWGDPEDESLAAKNLFGGHNDYRIAAMFDHFGFPEPK